MKLVNGKYIQHRIISRPWGTECQFTAVCPVSSACIDMAIEIDPKSDDMQLVAAVDEALSSLQEHRKNSPEEQPERIFTESAVVSLLVAKQYLQEGETLDSLKDASTLAKTEK